MVPNKPKRDRSWRAAGIFALIFAGGVTLALAQQPADTWIGRRVVQRHNNFPVRLNGQAVLRSGMEIHIYKVKRRDGDQLWLEGDDDGPRGWAAVDQLVPVDDALAYLTDRVRVHPDEAFYYALRATVYCDRKDFDRALGDWNKIVELEPDDAASYVGRAKLSVSRMEWDRAINDLTRAIKIDPEDPYCYRVRAHVWCAKHDYDEAINDCDHAIKLEPENPTAFVTRAHAWLGQQNYDHAITDATQAVRLDAKLPLAYLYRGLAWSRKKDFDKAIADYNAAIRLDAKDAEFYYSRAWAWQQKGDKARAMADYAVGVGLDPALELPGREPVSAHKNGADENEGADRLLSNLPLEHARPDAPVGVPAAGDREVGFVPASFNPLPAPALPNQPAAAHTGPDHAAAIGGKPATLSRDMFGIVEPQTALEFAERAGDWLRVKMYDKAITDCDQAIELGCHDPLAHVYRGLAWCEKKEYDKAIADYDEAIRLDAQNAFPYIARSSARTAKHEYDRADADLDSAARIEPEDPVIQNARAWQWATCPDARYRDGRRSVEAATKACELTGWHEGQIIDTLAAAYAEAGDFASAVKWQARAIELETDAKDKTEFAGRLDLYREKKAYRDTKP